MNEKQQIEEMTEILKDYTKKNNIMASVVILGAYAEALYNANYRKQSENTIELPCKVGDTIYLPWVWNDTSGVAILTVERMSITEAGQSVRTDLWSDDEDYWLAYNCGVFNFDNIGKTVFLTQEEAEKALAKMKGGAE